MAPIGHLLTMPILVINMGAEMIYILHQRLHAQNVKDLKAQKVNIYVYVYKYICIYNIAADYDDG